MVDIRATKERRHVHIVIQLQSFVEVTYYNTPLVIKKKRNITVMLSVLQTPKHICTYVALIKYVKHMPT